MKTVEQLIEIEKTVPIPPGVTELFLERLRLRQHKHPHKRGLPFDRMEIGDSFVVPSTQLRKSLSHLRMKAATASHRFNRRFMIDYDANKVLRCWRIS